MSNKIVDSIHKKSLSLSFVLRWLIFLTVIVITVLVTYVFATLNSDDLNEPEIAIESEENRSDTDLESVVEGDANESEDGVENEISSTESDSTDEVESDDFESAQVVEETPESIQENLDTIGIPFNPDVLEQIADLEEKAAYFLSAISVGNFYEPDHEAVFIIESLRFILSLQVDNASSIEYESGTDIENYRRFYLYVVSELLAYYDHRQLAITGDLHHHVDDLQSDFDHLRVKLEEFGEPYHYDQTY